LSPCDKKRPNVSGIDRTGAPQEFTDKSFFPLTTASYEPFIELGTGIAFILALALLPYLKHLALFWRNT
jgi:hypothetical protein